MPTITNKLTPEQHERITEITVDALRERFDGDADEVAARRKLLQRTRHATTLHDFAMIYIDMSFDIESFNDVVARVFRIDDIDIDDAYMLARCNVLTTDECNGFDT